MSSINCYADVPLYIRKAVGIRGLSLSEMALALGLKVELKVCLIR